MAAVTGLEYGDPESEEPELKLDGWIKSDFKQHNENQKKNNSIEFSFSVFNGLFLQPVKNLLRTLEVKLGIVRH